MKNLANCKPSEFLKQSNRIKRSVENWLTVTDVLNIRKNLPTLEKIDKDLDDEARKKIFEENKRKSEEQIRKNLSVMLDAILDEHPEETLELLALLCFVEPEDVDKYPMEDYLQCITEMLTNGAVIGFFTSLARLAQTNTYDA